MNKELAKIYENELTEQGLENLRNQYPENLVVDMSVEDEFKKARKTRTERNKLVEAINRRRIDTTNDLKTIGDGLVDSVEHIYSVVVGPFEVEDKRRKDEAKKLEQIKQDAIRADRDKINGFRGFVGQSQIGNSATVSSFIDALSNIDIGDFHDDVMREAMEAKEQVLSELTNILANKLQFEESERQRLELEAKLAAMEPAKEEPKAVEETKPTTTTTDNKSERVITVTVYETDQQAQKIFNEIDLLLTQLAPGADVVLQPANAA